MAQHPCTPHRNVTILGGGLSSNWIVLSWSIVCCWQTIAWCELYEKRDDGAVMVIRIYHSWTHSWLPTKLVHIFLSPLSDIVCTACFVSYIYYFTNFGVFFKQCTTCRIVFELFLYYNYKSLIFNQQFCGKLQKLTEFLISAKSKRELFFIKCRKVN